MTNRQRAAQETKQKLLGAGREILHEKGLANTSIAEITKRCGVASGTFYTYFKRKEDLIFALGRDLHQQILDRALAQSGTFLERLTFFMRQFAGCIEQSGLKLCQEWVRSTVDPDLVENEEDRGKLAFDIGSAATLLEDGIRRGEVRADAPVALLAHTLMDVLYGQMLCWDMSGGTYSFTARTEEFCANFLGCMFAPYLRKG